MHRTPWHERPGAQALRAFCAQGRMDTEPDQPGKMVERFRWLATWETSPMPLRSNPSKRASSMRNGSSGLPHPGAASQFAVYAKMTTARSGRIDHRSKYLRRD